MHFLAHFPNPAAGAAGLISRVQLPAAGLVPAHPQLSGARTLPSPSSERPTRRDSLTLYRAQHRAQCRAACLSKANF